MNRFALAIALMLAACGPAPASVPASSAPTTAATLSLAGGVTTVDPHGLRIRVLTR